MSTPTESWSKSDQDAFDAVCSWPAQRLPDDVLSMLAAAPHEPAAQTPAGTAPAVSATPGLSTPEDGQVEGATSLTAHPSPQGTIDFPPPDEGSVWAGFAVYLLLGVISLVLWGAFIALVVWALVLAGPAGLAGIGVLVLGGFLVWRRRSR